MFASDQRLHRSVDGKDVPVRLFPFDDFERLQILVDGGEEFGVSPRNKRAFLGFTQMPARQRQDPGGNCVATDFIKLGSQDFLARSHAAARWCLDFPTVDGGAKGSEWRRRCASIDV